MIPDRDFEGDLVDRNAGGRRQVGRTHGQLAGRVGRERAFARGRVVVHHHLIVQESGRTIDERILAEAGGKNRAADQDQREANHFCHVLYYFKNERWGKSRGRVVTGR